MQWFSAIFFFCLSPIIDVKINSIRLPGLRSLADQRYLRVSRLKVHRENWTDAFFLGIGLMLIHIFLVSPSNASFGCLIGLFGILWSSLLVGGGRQGNETPTLSGWICRAVFVVTNLVRVKILIINKIRMKNFYRGIFKGAWHWVNRNK